MCTALLIGWDPASPMLHPSPGIFPGSKLCQSGIDIRASESVRIQICKGRSRAHTVVTEEKAPRWPSWLCGGGGSSGSPQWQCWSVGQPVHSSLLPTMASIALDEDVFTQFKQESRKQPEFLFLALLLSRIQWTFNKGFSLPSLLSLVYKLPMWLSKFVSSPTTMDLWTSRM